MGKLFSQMLEPEPVQVLIRIVYFRKKATSESFLAAHSLNGVTVDKDLQENSALDLATK
jgi:hypothetical protein